MLLYGFPPKIMWLQTGNTGTQHLAELLVHRKQEIVPEFTFGVTKMSSRKRDYFAAKNHVLFFNPDRDDLFVSRDVNHR